MGDEIQDPRRTLPSAVGWGGLLAGVLYFGATLTLLLAVNKQEIASYRASFKGSATWRASQSALDRFSLCLRAEAFPLRGSPRLGFLVLRGFLSSQASISTCRRVWASCTRSMRRLTSRLIVHASLSAIFLGMSFVGAGVKEAFVTMLDLAVVLQLVHICTCMGRC